MLSPPPDTEPIPLDLSALLADPSSCPHPLLQAYLSTLEELSSYFFDELKQPHAYLDPDDADHLVLRLDFSMGYLGLSTTATGGSHRGGRNRRKWTSGPTSQSHHILSRTLPLRVWVHFQSGYHTTPFFEILPTGPDAETLGSIVLDLVHARHVELEEEKDAEVEQATSSSPSPSSSSFSFVFECVRAAEAYLERKSDSVQRGVELEEEERKRKADQKKGVQASVVVVVGEEEEEEEEGEEGKQEEEAEAEGEGEGEEEEGEEVTKEEEEEQGETRPSLSSLAVSSSVEGDDQEEEGEVAAPAPVLPPAHDPDPMVQLFEQRRQQWEANEAAARSQFESEQDSPFREQRRLLQEAETQKEPTYRNILTYTTSWSKGSKAGKVDLQERLVCNAYRSEPLHELVPETQLPETTAAAAAQGGSILSLANKRKRLEAGFVPLDSDEASHALMRVGHMVACLGDFVFVFGGIHQKSPSRSHLTNDLIVIDKKNGSLDYARSISLDDEKTAARRRRRRRRGKKKNYAVTTTATTATTDPSAHHTPFAPVPDAYARVQLAPPPKAFGSLTVLPPTHVRPFAGGGGAAATATATPNDETSFIDKIIARYDQPVAVVVQYGGVTDNDISLEASCVSVGEVRRRRGRDARRSNILLRRYDYVVLWHRMMSSVPLERMRGFTPVLRGNAAASVYDYVVFHGGVATVLDVVTEGPSANSLFAREVKRFMEGTVLGKMNGPSVMFNLAASRAHSSPSPRAGASMCSASGSVFLFGGHSPDGTVLSDLHRLDMSKVASSGGYLSWAKVDTYGMSLSLTNSYLFEGTVKSLTMNRKRFQATSNSSLLLVGGYDGTIWHTTFFELDTANYQWRIHVNGMGIGGVDDEEQSSSLSSSSDSSLSSSRRVDSVSSSSSPKTPVQLAFHGAAFVQKKHVLILGGTRKRTSFAMLDYRRVVESFTLQSAELVNPRPLSCYANNLFHTRKSHRLYAEQLEKWYVSSSEEICDVTFEIQPRKKKALIHCNLIVCETYPDLGDYVRSGPYSQHELDEDGQQTGRYVVRVHLDPELSSIRPNLFRRLLYFLYTNSFHFVRKFLMKPRIFNQIVAFAMKFNIDPLLDLCHRRLDAASLLRFCVPIRLGLVIAPYLTPKPLSEWLQWRSDRFSNKNGMIEILCRVADPGESVLSPMNSSAPLFGGDVFAAALAEVEDAEEIRAEYGDYIEEDETDADLRQIMVVHVHKGLICARSEFFRSMFASSYIESRRNRVRFNENEIGVQGIRLILSFMYTGRLSALTPEECVSVYLCCHKLALDELFPYIRDTIKKNLDFDTVLPVLHISDLYFDPKIQTFACHFFGKHALDVIQDEERREMYESVLSAGARSAAETVMVQHYGENLRELYLILGKTAPKKSSGTFSGLFG